MVRTLTIIIGCTIGAWVVWMIKPQNVFRQELRLSEVMRPQMVLGGTEAQVADIARVCPSDKFFVTRKGEAIIAAGNRYHYAAKWPDAKAVQDSVKETAIYQEDDPKKSVIGYKVEVMVPKIEVTMDIDRLVAEAWVLKDPWLGDDMDERVLEMKNVMYQHLASEAVAKGIREKTVIEESVRQTLLALASPRAPVREMKVTIAEDAFQKVAAPAIPFCPGKPVNFFNPDTEKVAGKPAPIAADARLAAAKVAMPAAGGLVAYTKNNVIVHDLSKAK